MPYWSWSVLFKNATKTPNLNQLNSALNSLNTRTVKSDLSSTLDTKIKVFSLEKSVQ